MINLYEIIQGKYRIKLRDSDLYFMTPSTDSLRRSYDFYNETLDEAYYAGVFLEQEALAELKRLNIWNDDHENQVTGLRKDIDNLKVKIYESFFNSSNRKNLKKMLINAKNVLNDKLGLKNSWQPMTCEGIAELSRKLYLISSNLYTEDNDKVNPDNYDINYILSYISSNRPTETEYRSLVRGPIWKSIFVCGDKLDLFSLPVTQLDDYQKELLYWNNYYQNIYNNPECPTEETINDDDALDGWSIIQRRQYDKARKENASKNTVKGNPNAGEVFVVAKNKEDIERVSGMNDDNSNYVKSQRIGTVKSRGVVDESEMPDVRQKINRQITQSIKNRK